MTRSKIQEKVDYILTDFYDNSDGTKFSIQKTTDEILAVIRLEKINTKAARTRSVHRDAVTGKFLSKEVAESRPNTTILQKIKQKFLPK